MEDMMKRKDKPKAKKVLIPIVVLLVLLVPLCVPYRIDILADGGSTVYSAVLYKLVRWKGMELSDQTDEFRLVTIKTSIYFYPKNKKHISELHDETFPKSNRMDEPQVIRYDLGDLADVFFDTPEYALPGQVVEIKAHVLMDADIYLYVGEQKLKKTHYESDYWGWSFVMPAAGVMITAKPYTKSE